MTLKASYDEEASKASEYLVVAVFDSGYQDLRASLAYAWVGSRFELIGFSVMPSAPEPGRAFTIRDIRDLPLSRWHRAALAFAIDWGRRQREQQAEWWSAVREVARVEPAVLDGLTDTPSARRRYATATKLAKVASQYRANILAGLNDPVAAIARDRDISPGAARALVHRARKAGYIGAASGPTAGEASSPLTEPPTKGGRDATREH